MTETVPTRYNGTETKPILEAFRYDCQVRNLTPRTIDCCLERLDRLMRYLDDNGIPLMSIDRHTIQDYIMHLRGTVSGETINGRIRVCRRFFNYLMEDPLWDKASPMAGVRILRAVTSPRRLNRNMGAGQARPRVQPAQGILVVRLPRGAIR